MTHNLVRLLLDLGEWAQANPGLFLAVMSLLMVSISIAAFVQRHYTRNRR